MSYEKVPMSDKRQALIDLVTDVVTNDFGEDFVIYDYPKTSFLQMGSRMERREVQENANGKIRHIDIFWDSPASPGSFPEINVAGIFRNGNIQRGAIDAFRFLLHYEVEYDTNGAINNRGEFEEILAGYNPDGILPTIRTKDSMKYNGRTILLSVPTNVTIPPSPSPMQSGGEEYAHYGEFRVFITDM